MESIKANSSLPEKPASQPPLNKMNQEDVFQAPKKVDTVESNSQKNPTDNQPWIVDGLAFPNGTEFRGKYKGYFYFGKVSIGALMLNGKEFLSPGAAATAITRSSVDGCLFWDCKPPGASSWINIHTLKQIKQQKALNPSNKVLTRISHE